MKKILKQYFKQVIVILILIATISILNIVFVKSSIKGDYDTIIVGITEGADAREIEKYLKISFKAEFDIKKKLEVEAVGSFGTEFRIKSDFILDEEKEFIDIKLNEKYNDKVSLSSITNNPEANYRVDFIMYGVYLIIILIIGFIAVYILYLIPINDEVNIKNIKKTRAELIVEENLKLSREEKQKIKEQKKKDRETKKEKIKKEKIKKEKIKKEKKKRKRTEIKNKKKDKNKKKR